MTYEYKVDYLEAKVTDRDIAKGAAWGLVVGQSETKLTQWNEDGWEFYRSEVISAEVQETSCFGKPTGNSTTTNVLIFIFRREIK